MQKYLINYADKMYYNSQMICTQKAIEVGKFDKIFQCNINDIDQKFIEENKSILSETRGAGYWLWKPYLIDKALRTIPEDSILFYLDSGAFFNDSVDSLIEYMKDYLNEGIVLFETSKWCPTGPPWEKCTEKFWTKGDVFYLLDILDNPEITETPQLNGATILMKNNKNAREFVSEWLEISKRREAITDDENVYHPNFEGFEDARHDQSILSCLAKKHKKPIFEDITQWGEPRKNGLGTYIIHHRNKR